MTAITSRVNGLYLDVKTNYISKCKLRVRRKIKVRPKADLTIVKFCLTTERGNTCVLADG